LSRDESRHRDADLGCHLATDAVLANQSPRRGQLVSRHGGAAAVDQRRFDDLDRVFTPDTDIDQ
jgi:hypothetical protein